MPNFNIIQNDSMLHHQQQQHQQQQQQPLLQQQINNPLNFTNVPILDEFNGMKKFNVNATRSNSSSSGTSSVMSSSFPNNLSVLLDNDFENDLSSLKYKNDLSKLFEDDVFFCPRSLLSQNELKTCEIIDRYLVEKMTDFNGNSIVGLSGQQQPKFNPYTSKSFNPTA